jgi:hypothetical protein
MQLARVPRFPPNFQSTVDLVHKFRFQSISAAPLRNAQVSRLGLIQLLAVGVAPVSLYTILDSIRIVAIKIYAVPDQVNPFAPSTATLRWISPLGKMDIETATGNAFAPATLSCQPPPDSLASFWTRRGAPPTTAADILIDMVLPNGSIVDLTVEMELQDGGSFPLAFLSAGPVTTGALVCMNLDNNSGSLPDPANFLAAVGYTGGLSAA